jgi:hypothetical protein
MHCKRVFGAMIEFRASRVFNPLQGVIPRFGATRVSF